MNNLFVFEIANNHQGSVEHAKRIIDNLTRIKEKFGITAAVKFQYRYLDTFIHPDYRINNAHIEHIPRFLSTELNFDQFLELIEYVKHNKLLTCVTPFDEYSVEKIHEHEVDIIKVASCSAKDWPLLERIALEPKPIILSTGGLQLNDVDNLVSFFSHKEKNFSLLHCVALYPAPFRSLDLDFIRKYRMRYPSISIGYSGHENPSEHTVQQLAVAKGATIFERHVGLETESISLNKYSLTPSQVDEWVKSVLEAVEICGQSREKRIDEKERLSLQSLRRGVYAKHKIDKGNIVEKEDVFFAMPCQDIQLSSGDFGKLRVKVVATKNYMPNEMIIDKIVEIDNTSKIRKIINYTKGVLNEANIFCDDSIEFEISHHFGLDKFYEFGVVLVTVVNRTYTKKLLIQQPGQMNPDHMHKQKEETFIVIDGSGYVNLEGKIINLVKGDKILIEPGKMHSFGTQTGVVFEEISTTHFRADSFYKDDNIARLDPMERKTIVFS